MNFKDILKELVRGKKVRRKHWQGNYFLKLGKDIIVDCFGKPFQFKITSFTGTDWGVYEEKPKVIILDDNEISIMKYAEEYPENWKEICDSLEKKGENEKHKTIRKRN